MCLHARLGTSLHPAAFSSSQAASLGTSHKLYCWANPYQSMHDQQIISIIINK